MIMHKTDALIEAGGPPLERIVQQMGQFVPGGIQSGVFIDGAGLQRVASAPGVRGSTRSVSRGPFEAAITCSPASR